MNQKSINMLKRIILLSVVSIGCPTIEDTTERPQSSYLRLATVSVWLSSRTPEGLGKAIQAYEDIATSPKVHSCDRVVAARELIRLGEKRVGIAALLSIATSDKAEEVDKLNSAYELETLGERAKAMQAYGSIINDPKVTDSNIKAQAQARAAIVALQAQTQSSTQAASAAS